MRSILLHAHDDDEFDARLEVALDLARAFDAHVTMLQAVSLDFIAPGDFYGAMAADMIHVVKERAQNFREESERKLRGEDVRWEWVDRIGLGDQALLKYAALSDLVVLGSTPPEAGKGPSWLAGTIAIHARVPILAVPPDARGLDIGAPALVGWNGSTESSRALRAAVPLLAKAASVTLATVGRGEDDGEDADLPAIEGAEYLARHGIECELVELAADGTKPVAGVLGDAARARGAGLMVMGAYGQSRMLETILGGATRDMLADAPMPVLMAH